MVAITLMGRDFDVAAYKIGAMRKAAPFITRINETAGALSTLEGAVEASADMIGFLSIGLAKIDPALTPDFLENELGLEDAPALQTAMLAVVEASGLSRKGEATAPSAPETPEGA